MGKERFTILKLARVSLRIVAGTCSWSINHLQLVELCLITDVTDSIRASTRHYTIIGYVQNGYYPVMKCSVRILLKMRG